MLAYTGIGSRSTPVEVLDMIEQLARGLRSRGYTLRSGHATGADQAFERGAGPDAEVYLPWAGFEHTVRCDARYLQPAPSPAAVEMAAAHHPAWDRLSRGPRALHARNCHQILGADLASPASFVVCWTPDGATTEPTRETGGTGQALRIAAAHRIPVFNLALPEHHTRIQSFLNP